MWREAGAQDMNPKNQHLLETYKKSLARPHEGFEAVAEAFLDKVGNKEPSMADVRSWVRRKGYRPSTLRKEFGVLRRLFVVNGLKWEAKRGEAPKGSEKEETADRLGPNLIREMIGIARGRAPSSYIPPSPAHKAFLALSTMWGLRRGEMSGITPEFLDLKGSLLYVQTEKHGKARWHYVPPEIMPVLLEWGFKQRLTDWQTSALFVDWRAMAGLELPPGMNRLGWHAIRGTLSHELLAAGLSIPEVSKFLRWRRAESEMSLRYAGMNVLERSGITRVLSVDEQKADLRVLKVHPFLASWSSS
jgi:integrase